MNDNIFITAENIDISRQDKITGYDSQFDLCIETSYYSIQISPIIIEHVESRQLDVLSEIQNNWNQQEPKNIHQFALTLKYLLQL